MLLGILAGTVIPKVQLASGIDFLPAVGPGSAVSLLSAFAGGLITVIGLIVSIVIAALTFGSGSITPRLIKQWEKDQVSRVMVGILIFSVVYAFVLVGQIAPLRRPNSVPTFAVWLIVPLILVDIVALLQVTRRLGHLVRFVESMDAAREQGIAAINRLFPYQFDAGVPAAASTLPATQPAMIVASPRVGVVSDVDGAMLSRVASKFNATVELVPGIGGYVEQGTVLFRVWSASPVDESLMLRAVTFSDERVIDKDPLYALRIIVDIAIRALSAAINDPTTAVQALDRITSFLGQISSRRLDMTGAAGLVIRAASWEEAVELGFSEIRQFGGTSAQVLRKIRACLQDLKASVPVARVRAIDEQLELLDACAHRNFTDPHERGIACAADPLGFGAPRARHAGAATERR